MTRYYALALFLFVAAGCAHVADMDDLPQSHPANPDAESAPDPDGPALLDVHLMPPDTKPMSEGSAHDHLQQKEPAEKAMPSGQNDLPEGRYVCPKHPDRHSAFVGNCPLCNRPMVLRRTSPATSPQKSESATPVHSAYMCTMHPQLALQSPGICPQCSMTLVPRGDDAQ